MNNIYLNNKSLGNKKLIKYMIVAFLSGVLFILIQKVGIINTEAQRMFDLTWSVIIILVLIQTVSPKLAQCVVDEFSIRQKTIGAVIVPIVVGLLKRILTDVLQVLPYMFGGEVIGIAKGQLNMESFNFVETLLVGSILGPFYEEVLFRVVFFTVILYIAGWIDSKYNKNISRRIFNFKSVFCWVLIILNGALFSWSHEPDITNFHLYFIGGLAYAVVYIKYGLFSAWLSHGIYNLIHLSFIFSLFGIE